MKNLSYLFFILFSFIGCSGTLKKEDVQQQDKVSVIRFDKALYDYIQKPDSKKESGLKSKYPELLSAFGQIATNKAIDVDSVHFFTELVSYFSHPMLQTIYKDELAVFADMQSYEDELSGAKALAAANLPHYKFPQFAIHVSGFKENAIILDNLISLSGDKYLGRSYSNYQEFFAPYQRQQMDMKLIVRDYLKAWVMSDVLKVNNNEQTDLLSAMVDEGKMLYALSILLPDYKADDLISYTPQQLEWCKENEKSIWKKIVKEDNLFTKDHMIITRYINDAPYTATISQQSPGRVGSWVGWQIVSQLASKKNTSLSEIIMLDAATILKESKYNP